MEGFIDPSMSADARGKIPAAGGMFTGAYLRQFFQDDLRLPVIRAGFNAGGFIGGSLGNTIVVGTLVEVMMRYRISANVGVLYIVPTHLTDLHADLGGLSFRVAGGFNWE
jgi:hypothetical protein